MWAEFQEKRLLRFLFSSFIEQLNPKWNQASAAVTQFIGGKLEVASQQRVGAGYLQVGPHERRPGLHQEVADGPLASGGGFVQRRLTSERPKTIGIQVRVRLAAPGITVITAATVSGLGSRLTSLSL